MALSIKYLSVTEIFLNTAILTMSNGNQPCLATKIKNHNPKFAA